ncbi:MAG: methionine--tRNA ligase [Candidatus Micrarchaeota archaeon]|nr:methionine--tRNA ligase [Candidatus Micrarchaeota archaeon]
MASSAGETSTKRSKKILITSALPYVNNVPHLGNIIGCVLSADVFARYCRSRGYETIYVCGTDEYGTATEAKALEEKVTPRELCDKYHAIHKKIYEWFGISTDIFGRTTTPLHNEITHEIFLELHKNGYVIEDDIVQAFDEKANMFLADRFIEGTCPFCKSDGARADQCDKCGKLLNFEELINPKSKLTGTTPVKRSSHHLFIDLPGIEKELGVWIEKAAKEGEWSENSLNIAKGWLAEGLKKRCITRDLKWGVPVPLKGWENKVFYVWFDAPIGYISITANLRKDWREWWQNPEGVRLYQFMGKDNVPFHTVIFPSTLMGTKKKWTMLHHISTTEFLNFEGGKFSKSKGVGVFGNDAIESGIPADVWRYYLLTNRPEKMDTDFTWKDFGEKNNNEILANIGNLVNRTLVFAGRECEGKVPQAALSDEDRQFVASQNAKFSEVGALLERVQLKDALHLAFHASKEANAYFQRNEPWKTAKTDRARCSAAIYVLIHQVKDLAIALEPFIPHTSAAIFKQLSAPQENWEWIGKLTLLAGHQLGKPEILFKKIEEKELKSLAEKYSGKQNTAKSAAAPAAPTLDPGMIDLEVGKIISIERHPNAEKLYVEQVQMGGGEVRQVISGIVPYYAPEELLNKLVIIVKNLKPAAIRNKTSNGMLLACEKDGKLEVLPPPADAKPGDKVDVAGVKRQLGHEITIEHFLTVKMEVKDGIAYADGKELLVNGKPVKTEKVKEGKVR